MHAKSLDTKEVGQVEEGVHYSYDIAYSPVPPKSGRQNKRLGRHGYYSERENRVNVRSH